MYSGFDLFLNFVFFNPSYLGLRAVSFRASLSVERAAKLITCLNAFQRDSMVTFLNVSQISGNDGLSYRCYPSGTFVHEGFTVLDGLA